MSYRVFILIGFIFVCSCGGGGGSAANDNQVELTGSQSAEISGLWRSGCNIDWWESDDDALVYSIDEHEFNEGLLTINTSLYSDSSCSNLIETSEYHGTYELGELVEISENLFAREISETYDPLIEGIRSITWNAYYFISEDTLYFGGDRGENDEEPSLILEKPYTFIGSD